MQEQERQIALDPAKQAAWIDLFDGINLAMKASELEGEKVALRSA
jgi:hypothetical protein